MKFYYTLYANVAFLVICFINYIWLTDITDYQLNIIDEHITSLFEIVRTHFNLLNTSSETSSNRSIFPQVLGTPFVACKNIMN